MRRSSPLAGSHSSGLRVKGDLSDRNYYTLDRSELLFLRATEIACLTLFLSWGTLWDAMAIAPLRLPRLGQGSRSPESWVSPPKTRLNTPSCTNDFLASQGHCAFFISSSSKGQ